MSKSKDTQLIWEAYTKELEEGIVDRMKARGAGLAQSVGGLKNTANKIVGGAKAVVGSAIGNQNMMTQGGQQAHAATQQANARSTGADVKAGAINTSFTSKIDKELQNFNNRLSKSLNVTDPQQLLTALQQASPEMANVYTAIQQITNQIKATPAQPTQAPVAPQNAPQQPGTPPQNAPQQPGTPPQSAPPQV